jgi:hypothetical protein
MTFAFILGTVMVVVWGLGEAVVGLWDRFHRNQMQRSSGVVSIARRTVSDPRLPP